MIGEHLNYLMIHVAIRICLSPVFLLASRDGKVITKLGNT